MNIFLSYPSSHRHAVESVCYELQAEGHEVFFDKEDLPPGQGYNERIRHAIENCDLFIFMITPESVCKGKYTLTELKIAIRKWPNPASHVLPVMLETTSFEAIPAYLKAVTLLSPEGNLTAEIAMEVADLQHDKKVDRQVVKNEPVLPKLSYQPLEIRFGAGSTGEYPISISHSPAGDIDTQSIPFDPTTVEQLLQTQNSQQNQTLRLIQTYQNETDNASLPSLENAKKIGEQLHQLLFTSTVKSCLFNSLKSINPQQGQGLRFLVNTTEAPDLARLPWEFLYSSRQNDFLFTDIMKPVVRWLDVDQPPPSLTVKPPLRLLITIASPTNRPELNVGKELSRLDKALRDLIGKGLIDIQRLEHTTLEKLDSVLLQYKPHVLHFIGHGDFNGNEGKIILESNTPEGAHAISGPRLGVLLRNHLGSLRFVFLNSCLGAKTSNKNPFSGVAQSLIQRGIPAAIAMQFPIPDRAAVSLARHFYRYLAAGQPVDAAITSTRAFLFAKGFDVEWGAPVLYMRTPDGRLFDIDSDKVNQTPFLVPPHEVPQRPNSQDTEAKQNSSKKWWLWLLFLSLIVIATVITISTNNNNVSKQTPSPNQIEIAENNYNHALTALKQGNTQSAIKYLKIAKEKNSSLLMQEQYLNLRSNLISELVNRAGIELADGNYELSQSIADHLQEIDSSEFQKLQEQITKAIEQINLVESLNEKIKSALANNDLSTAQELINQLKMIAPDQPNLHQIQQEINKLLIEPTSVIVETSKQVYKVMPGDTLWAIAEDAYGDAKLWPRIFRANKDKIKSPDLIYLGLKLNIPAHTDMDNSLIPYKHHLVKKGDTLWQISNQIYGDPLRWPEIYKTNQNNITNPDYIFPNQKLRIPNY